MADLFIFFPQPHAISEVWEGDAFGGFDQIVGRTALGDMFLLDPKTGHYGILETFRGKVHATTFDTRETFVSECLNKPKVIENILNQGQPGLVAELSARLGPLKVDEVYIPAAYPFLGGTCAPETYYKGDVWVFLNLVSQALGMADSYIKVKPWWKIW
jgi:hypothetical protein